MYNSLISDRKNVFKLNSRIQVKSLREPSKKITFLAEMSAKKM